MSRISSFAYLTVRLYMIIVKPMKLKKFSRTVFAVLFMFYSVLAYTGQDKHISILKQISNISEIPAHRGLKIAHFYKNGKSFSTKNEIRFVDMTHFLFKTLEPDKYAGNLIAADGENFLMYMPRFRTRLKTKLRTDIRLEKGLETLHLNIDRALLDKNYEVSYIGAGKALGQDVLIFQLKGKLLPFTQKIWVTKQKPLILKEERYYNGKKYYNFHYTEISFGTPSPEELKPEIPITAFPLPSKNDLAFYDSVDKARKHVKNVSIPVLKKLPQGYVFSHVELMKTPLGDFVSSLYTDGLSGIRVGKRKEGGFFEGMLKFMGLDMKEIQNDIQNYSPMNFYEVKKGDEFIGLSSELPPDVLKKYMLYFSEAQ